jgi:glycine cleavage system H protein
MNKYHAEHTWIRIEGDTALVGITQHAQDTLGDIVFVDFADVGKTFSQGTVAGVVESVKAAADVHMPASVEILEHNEALRADPSLANTDPEGAGWFCKVQLSELSEIEGLMDASAYAGFAGLI